MAEHQTRAPPAVTAAEPPKGSVPWVNSVFEQPYPLTPDGQPILGEAEPGVEEHLEAARVDVVNMAQVDHHGRRVVPQRLQDAIQQGGRSLLELAAQAQENAAVEPPLELNCQAFRAHPPWTLPDGYPDVTCPARRASRCAPTT